MRPLRKRLIYAKTVAVDGRADALPDDPEETRPLGARTVFLGRLHCRRANYSGARIVGQHPTPGSCMCSERRGPDEEGRMGQPTIDPTFYRTPPGGGGPPREKRGYRAVVHRAG